MTAMRDRMAENLERKYSWNDRRGQNDRKAIANGMIAVRLYNDETRYPESIRDTNRLFNSLKFAECFRSSVIANFRWLICAPKILTGRVSEMNMFVTRCLLLKVLSIENSGVSRLHCKKRLAIFPFPAGI
jgi:hypothetical protein